ncbi:hypothetical protein KSP40_PGU012090 [Platanthera guangdongensis]|uniref:Uncharacterized protein n=1 Tax=Platanthera guangdongensis TaxID=2320717 RepID=A0ABR2MKQ4_9ASPA
MDTADHKPSPLPTPTSPPPEIEPKTSTIKSGNEPSCSSSDSDTDSDDGFFQIDVPDLPHLPPISTGEGPLINLDDSLLDTNVREMRLSTEYLGSRSEERESPVVQVMERNKIADPGRIPSYVFDRRSPAPMEWSAASNESLFSIAMEATSFSGDQVFLMGRSGDLGGGLTSGLMEYLPPGLTPSMSNVVRPGMTGENESGAILDLGTMEETAATANAEAMRDVMRAAVEEREREREVPAAVLRRHSISRHSDGSTTSFRSFAFPILWGDGGVGSTKAESLHHIQFHPLSRAAPRKAAPKSAAAAPTSSPGPAPASIQSLCSSCFSCCSC